MKNQNGKSKYLPRILQRSDEKGESAPQPIADMEFARLSGPKVLLGAPGGGKTSVCEAVVRQLNGQLAWADGMACGLFKTPPEFEGQILVIDGLDEVSSQSISEAFAKIIKAIEKLGYDNWLVSCRSYEWRSESFHKWVEDAFGKFPEIAHLYDLSDDEIKAFLEVFITDDSAEQFIKNAEEKGATDFLQNPQTLQMLVQAVGSDGWPKTKTDLLRSACKVMASEDNPLHQEKRSNHPNEEKIIEIAGWVCVQLLMSGAQEIALDGRVNKNTLRPADLENLTYSIENIKAACKTKLFKSAGAVGRVEPVHRTVAEFLAGQWLADAFKAKPRKLSPARVINYLTSFGTGAIPPALYGLYAWIASLDDSNRCQNIKHNPYVCLRYGDLSRFSDRDLITFLKEFRAFAEEDPFFLGEDRHAQLNRGLGSASIKDDFLDTISNGAPYQLVVTLLRAIRGTNLANAMVDELRAIVLDEKISFSKRFAAIDALTDRLEVNDWVELADCLLSYATEDSLELSINGIIANKSEHFSAQKIAEHLITYQYATAAKASVVMRGMGFSISKICPEDKTLEIAQLLAEKMPKCITPTKLFIPYYLQRWLSKLLLRLLKKTDKLTAHELWPLISRLNFPVREIIWEEETSPWFNEHDDIRRKIQSLALKETENGIAMWEILRWLSEVSRGLHVRGSDVVYHLEELIFAKDTLPNWQDRWRNLVKLGRDNRAFDGNVLNLASEQAENFPELKPILEDILTPPVNEHEANFEKRRRERSEKELAETRKRHAEFTEVRGAMEQGEHLPALGDAAKGTLGHYSDVKKTSSPKENIIETVGQENVAPVIMGFEAAVKKDGIPSVRDCIDLRVYKGAEYHIEVISLALSMLTLESGKSLALLPKKAQLCALLASWLEWDGDERKPSEEIRVKLETILFKDRENKRNFVKDMIEPSLEAGRQGTISFWRIGHDEIFSDILPELTLEWLSKFENIAENILLELLNIAIRLADYKSNFADIVEAKIQAGTWASEGHRCAWHAVAFSLDFDRFHSAICKFANEDKRRLFSFKHIITSGGDGRFLALSLNVKQIAFLLETFAPQWPVSSPQESTWMGSNNPWDASNYLQSLIRTLGGEGSEEAIQCLECFVVSERMSAYQGDLQHALANAKRALAERQYQETNLEDVRKILSSGKPVNVSDLQTLFIEKFEEYQAKIRTGHTDAYKIFWDRDEPHVENYCRDRLLDGLEQEMGTYGVRIHKEGAMANETRVDLLLSCGDFDLPVEIKRQWHLDIWTAAHEQLERYSENYRTDGTGVYLVIWHGDVEGKTIPKPPKGERPKSAEEMLQALHDNLGDLSPKTKIVVLDVSNPASKKK